MVMLAKGMETRMTFHNSASSRERARRRVDSADASLTRGWIRTGGLPFRAPDGLPQCGAVEVFAQIDKREKCIEDARLHFVGQDEAAR
jgi:hypothetical protein